jgi:asparagine synthase (glutamine-hydrolysing)
MCGFAGVVAFDHRYGVSQETLRKMSQRIAHRGPDGEGYWFSPENAPGPRVALAHRRLAILDLDPRSNQPFTDGRHWLVYNGEIYNFRELRKELDYDWKTTGDTEVILAAYEKWGLDCVKHFNGMFAFALWDSRENSLLLARDRMGQKPLMVSFIESAGGSVEAVAFASEIGALLPVEWINRGINSVALAQYLRWGYSRRECLVKGIRALLPGQIWVTKHQAVHEKLREDPKSSSPTGGDLIQRTRELIRQAVTRQLVSDVALGCFLSGGIDSSIVAAAMRAAVPKEQKVLTFSIGFDDPRYDESEYAAEVAAHLGTDHHSFIVHPNAAEDLPKLATAFGEPIADSSALATHYLSRETRKYVKVALSGDGGDELFGGYDRYRALRFLRDSRVFSQILPLANLLPGSHPKSLPAKLNRLAKSKQLPEPARYASYVRLMDEELVQSLFKSKPREHDLIEHLFSLARRMSETVEAAMCVDRWTYLPEDVLVKVDRCSMLHALEVRSPFLDPDLVDFACDRTESELMGEGPKALLRRAFAADLPKSVFRRKKMGFAVPIGDWLRTSLRPMLHDSLFAVDSFAAGHFNRPVIEKMIADHQEKRQDHSQRLYALLMLELWWRGVAKM